MVESRLSLLIINPNQMIKIKIKYYNNNLICNNNKLPVKLSKIRKARNLVMKSYPNSNKHLKNALMLKIYLILNPRRNVSNAHVLSRMRIMVSLNISKRNTN